GWSGSLLPLLRDAAPTAVPRHVCRPQRLVQQSHAQEETVHGELDTRVRNRTEGSQEEDRSVRSSPSTSPCPVSPVPCPVAQYAHVLGLRDRLWAAATLRGTSGYGHGRWVHGGQTDGHGRVSSPLDLAPRCSVIQPSVMERGSEGFEFQVQRRRFSRGFLGDLAQTPLWVGHRAAVDKS
ncbi:hypothetical protein Z043_120634, partial [Scleropages formosus]